MSTQEPIGSPPDRLGDLEQEVAALKSSMATRDDIKDAIKQLCAVLNGLFAGPFDKGDGFGFDINDNSHMRHNPQVKAAPGGQFITGVTTYYEDGHIKMVFNCQKLQQIQTTV